MTAIFLAVAVSLSVASADDAPLRVCLVSGSEEYHSDETLAAFAAELRDRYGADCTLLKATDVAHLPGTEALDTCDVALFFTRRLTIDGESLEHVKKYVLESGKPIVGVRTASHGFQNWLEMDRLAFGGSYAGHYKNELTTDVTAAAPDHPTLAGFRPFTSKGSLYKVKPLADGCAVLLEGQSPEATEPVAWTRTHNGARVLYTSLGHPDDFAEPSFRRFLALSLFWTAGREAPDGGIR